jgi:AcrR family transcriptional regulator
VDTALKLFAEQGYHATGIDKILAESGVAKMTLYKHFKSKEELILAVLRLRDERFRNWFMRAVERRASSAKERLLALFDALEEWVGGDEFNGCMFINACAEFACHDDPIHAASAEHKRLILGYVKGLAEAAGASAPDVLAMQLCLLIEGTIALVQVTGRTEVCKEAHGAAAILVCNALAGSSA